MVKVFLVDDEIVIREGIRNSFPWEESGYTLVGEAPDGEIALPMIRDANPDILITDIRMPFMDGMQLCREVKRQMPWLGVVILSGYDDFDYARQAISLGVKEYLLKPITAQELKDVLDRISARLAEERRAREDMALMRRRLHSGSQFVREKLLSSLFTDEPMEEGEAAAMIEQMRTLGINLAAKCYAVIDMAFSSPAAPSRCRAPRSTPWPRAAAASCRCAPPGWARARWCWATARTTPRSAPIPSPAPPSTSWSAPAAPAFCWPSAKSSAALPISASPCARPATPGT